jgi:hypothetical protein
MAEFMNQNDVHRLSSFIFDCFLTRALGGGPALIFESVSCRVDLQAVGMLLMWMMMSFSRAPPSMILVLIFLLAPGFAP